VVYIDVDAKAIFLHFVSETFFAPIIDSNAGTALASNHFSNTICILLNLGFIVIGF
jgi:hypothetical protein